jgi:hypothetical protein
MRYVLYAARAARKVIPWVALWAASGALGVGLALGAAHVFHQSPGQVPANVPSIFTPSPMPIGGP